MPSKAREYPPAAAVLAAGVRAPGTHLRLEDPWVRPGPGHQGQLPAMSLGERISSGAPVAPRTQAARKDSGGSGLCLHRLATWQKEQTGVVVALGSTAEPPG